MREILDDIDRWRASGQRVAVARVVDIEGSGPRDPGAAMAVRAVFRRNVRRVAGLDARSACGSAGIGLLVLDEVCGQGRPKRWRALSEKLPNYLAGECPGLVRDSLTGVSSAGFDRARGTVKENLVPRPTSLSTPIRPPCASTIPLAIASPRPEP